jgi:hypothetical protein
MGYCHLRPVGEAKRQQFPQSVRTQHAAKGRSVPRPLIKSAALALLAAGEVSPGSILELSEETEGATEEGPCCVSALLGCLANAPVTVGSTLHAIASTVASRSVLTSTMLRTCFEMGGAVRESLSPGCPCGGPSFRSSLLFERVNNLAKCMFSCEEVGGFT